PRSKRSRLKPLPQGGRYANGGADGTISASFLMASAPAGRQAPTVLEQGRSLRGAEKPVKAVPATGPPSVFLAERSATWQLGRQSKDAGARGVDGTGGIQGTRSGHRTS